MANLLQIGQHTINLDLVTYFHDQGGAVTVWFGPGHSLPFSGDEAATLQAWLKVHATAAPQTYLPKLTPSPHAPEPPRPAVPEPLHLGDVWISQDIPEPEERVRTDRPTIGDPDLHNLPLGKKELGTLEDE